MAFLWLLSCFALIWATFGGGAPTSEPELSIIPRIINGKDALPGSWPWHVALQYRSGKIFCGGTLIDRFWVMTAAHCNVSTSARVVTGLYDRSSSLDKTQVLRIVKIFVHPKYNSYNFFGDIALLQLTSPARVHDTVSPAVLPHCAEELFARTRCIIMGWGYTHPEMSYAVTPDENLYNSLDTRSHMSLNCFHRYSSTPADPPTSSQSWDCNILGFMSTVVPLKLQQATVTVTSNAECKKHWFYAHSPTMVCAWDKNISNFKGDSGGPLVCPKNGLWKVVGIASNANITHPTSKPVMFTRVAPFIPWVREVMDHNRN